MTVYDIRTTLFVSDLDGTLLKSDGTLAPETAEEINCMVGAGLRFSFATARSYHTAMTVAGSIKVNIPLILHNGVFITERSNGAILRANYLEPIDKIAEVLREYKIEPIVFSKRGDRQYFSYLPDRINAETAAFNAPRQADPRNLPIYDPEKLWDGDVFCVTCIGNEAALARAYEKLKDVCHCIFGKDYYSGEPWLEMISPRACKAAAIVELREMLGCERVVVFGDGNNDMEMFEAADECYAVSNAIPELKACPTAVIGHNDDGAVVRWLKENVNL